MSCFDCLHNQPDGCALDRPEYETYEPCPVKEEEDEEH